MLRIIGWIFVVILLAAVIAWFSMQSLPTWFDEESDQQDQVIEQLKTEIDRHGARQFLGKKLQQILKGELIMTEAEFNALFLASLEQDQKGREALAMTDAVKVFLHQDEVEIAIIVNLDKVEKINPKARKAVEKFDKLFFFLDGSRLSLTIFAKAVARNGQIGVTDDFRLKVGAIPITNNTLRQLGVKVERANQENLALKLLSIKSVELSEDQIRMGVTPRF